MGMVFHFRKHVSNHSLINHTTNTKHVHNKCINIKKHLFYSKKMFFLKKSPYFYIYKTHNFTMSFTKHLVVKNGFIYMLLENIIFLNYLINKYHFRVCFSFVQLKKDILKVSKESVKKNGTIKLLLKPCKSLFSIYNVKMLFMIMFFPKKKKLYSKINLKILKLQNHNI